jgi:hypothetical protein
MITTTAKTWIAFAALIAFTGIGAVVGVAEAARQAPADGSAPVAESSHATAEAPEYYNGYDVFGRPLDGVGGRIMPVVTPG